jgi:hypothetical protein
VHQAGLEALSTPKTKLSLMHQIGTKNSDVLTEPGKHRLTNTKRLHRLFISTGQKMLIMLLGNHRDAAKNTRKREIHGDNPFHMPPAQRRAQQRCGDVTPQRNNRQNIC